MPSALCELASSCNAGVRHGNAIVAHGPYSRTGHCCGSWSAIEHPTHAKRLWEHRDVPGCACRLILLSGRRHVTALQGCCQYATSLQAVWEDLECLVHTLCVVLFCVGAMWGFYRHESLVYIHYPLGCCMSVLSITLWIQALCFLCWELSTDHFGCLSPVSLTLFSCSNLLFLTLFVSP